MQSRADTERKIPPELSVHPPNNSRSAVLRLNDGTDKFQISIMQSCNVCANKARKREQWHNSGDGTIKMYKQWGAKVCFGNLSKSQPET